MSYVIEKLASLGVDLDSTQTESTINLGLPEIVFNVVKHYEHYIYFEKPIVFQPNYKSGLEGKDGTLPLELLWGQNEGKYNILSANTQLKNLEADSDLFSIGLSYSSNHVCISLSDGSICLSTNGEAESRFKLFDSATEFFRALHVEDNNKNTKLDGIKSNLRF
ncbi:hypothetical protein [Enterovibrio norvegicus]|uniref:hypothetical protein n=1 Tax=Enterovibrio norvegicus TaxID=188144 RepID=UPI00352CEB82